MFNTELSSRIWFFVCCLLFPLSLSFRLYAFVASACWFALSKVLTLAFLSLYIHWAIEPLSHWAIGHWLAWSGWWMLCIRRRLAARATPECRFDLILLPCQIAISNHCTRMDGWGQRNPPNLSFAHFFLWFTFRLCLPPTYLDYEHTDLYNPDPVEKSE